MSEITINKNNLNRFEKRLKKGLEEELGISIPLHVASKIFAKALGVSNRFELQANIDKPFKNEFEKQAEEFYEIIVNFINSNPKSQFTHLSIEKIDDVPVLYLSAKGKNKKDNEYGFSIFFNTEKHEYINTNLSKMNIDENHEKFILNLKDKFICKTKEENEYLGKCIFKYLQNKGSLNFLNHKKELSEIEGFGILQEELIIVNENFIENEGLPYTVQNKDFSYLDLKDYTLNNKVEYCSSVEQALNHLQDNKIILNFLHLPNNRINGICSFYIYKENNDIFITSVTEEMKKQINNASDCEDFLKIGKIKISTNEDNSIKFKN